MNGLNHLYEDMFIVIEQIVTRVSVMKESKDSI